MPRITTCVTCTKDQRCTRCRKRVAADDPMIGKTLDGRYLIKAKIAEGGFGTVYRGRWVQQGRADQPVAIKVLHEKHSADPAMNARFRREAAALANLASRHTVHTYEYGEDKDTGTRFLVMELLAGESLYQRFAACETLHWRVVLAVIRQVCESLAELHAQGIVHRDLKPANIFLLQKPWPDFVKVLDFGIAKFPEQSPLGEGGPLTEIGHTIGTLEYMSPEQILAGAVDGRSDIYTLGVVMYEMIVGARPFNESDPASLLTAIMTRNPIPASARAKSKLPDTLDHLLQRCLMREPKDRYADVKQLAKAIDEVLLAYDPKHSTLKQWGNLGNLSAEEAEQTWVAGSPQAKSPRKLSRPPIERMGPDLIVAMDSKPSPDREAAIRAPLVEIEVPLRTVKGTGVPSVNPEELLGAPIRVPLGSSPRIEDLPVKPPMAFIWKLLIAILVLGVIGLVAGAGLADLLI